MTNREKIMRELVSLSNADFARAIEEAICPSCYSCPKDLHESCRTKDYACITHIENWLNQENIEQNLIKFIY